MLKLQVIGHLGKDATLKENNGISIANFSVAHTEKFTDKNGTRVERTQWVDCARFFKPNEGTGIVQYLKKGTLVYVEGHPSTEIWAPQNGDPTAQLKLRVLNIQLLGAAKNNTAEPAPADAPVIAEQPVAESVADVKDDLPF